MGAYAYSNHRKAVYTINECMSHVHQQIPGGPALHNIIIVVDRGYLNHHANDNAKVRLP